MDRRAKSGGAVHECGELWRTPERSHPAGTGEAENGTRKLDGSRFIDSVFRSYALRHTIHCRTVGALEAERQLAGRPLNMADGLIAATALEHGLTLVTRNVRDFSELGITLFNPWEAT